MENLTKELPSSTSTASLLFTHGKPDTRPSATWWCANHRVKLTLSQPLKDGSLQGFISEIKKVDPASNQPRMLRLTTPFWLPAIEGTQPLRSYALHLQTDTEFEL